MMKKSFLKGMAAVAMGLAVVGCSHESDGIMPTHQDTMTNAAEKLGVEIDPNQDWNMTSTIKATIAVNLGLDQNYTVGIYDANPQFSENVHFYAKKSITEGGSVDLSFEAPSAESAFYVAVFDSKGRYLVQSAPVVDGQMDVTFGSTFAGTRATEAESPTYAKTLNDFLNPTVETCAEFVSQNDQLKGIVSSLEVVDNTLSASTMHQYTAFTNADLAKQSTLSNLIYEQATQGTTTTETAEYKVAAGYNPASGTSVNVMNGSTKVGTLSFGDRVYITPQAQTEEASFWYGKMNTNSSIFSIVSGDWDRADLYGGGYVINGTHEITLAPTKACSVTIEQSASNANSIKFDKTEYQISSSELTGPDYAKKNVYTIQGVSAGTHKVTMGSGKSGILKITVTYSAGAASSTSITDNGSYTDGGYTSRLPRTYYRFVPEKDGTLTFYHKSGGSNNAITIKDNNGYYQHNNQNFHNWSWYDANIGITVVAGHTYELTLNTEDDGLYVVKMSYTETTGGTEAKQYYVGHGDGKHYRVAAGTEVTSQFHINSTYGKVNETVIYVEGKLHIGDNYTLNGVALVVANGGEIVIDGTANMSNAGRFVVMPGGKITGTDTGVFNVNNGMPCYNAGTIDYDGELNINGSNFYNCGTVDVDVLRNTSGGLITNFGHITARTNMNAADAYNCTFVNGCYMHYTEQAGIGHLTMLKNSRLDVDGLCEFNQSWQTLDVQTTTPNDLQSATIAHPNILMDKSVINVGTAWVVNTVFQGPSNANEIAIVKMGKVKVGNGTDLMQRQNCYFDWDITELYSQQQGTKFQVIPAEEKVHNPYGYLVDYYRVHVTKFITEASSPVSIPAAEDDNDCTGDGYNPTGETKKVEDRPSVWSYAFEDTPLGDYDMNDVVLKVSYAYDEEEGKVDYDHLDVTLCCTGATLELKAYLGETALFGGEEVHKVLGNVAPNMLNTGAGPTVTPVTVTINTPTDFQFGTADFWIDSPLVPGGVHIAKQGQDPHGVVIPGDWAWPTEYTCIKVAYPNFVEFAKDASTTSEAVKGWYKKTSTNPVAGKTFKQ